MTDRGNCWSITINNPSSSDLAPCFPNSKWIMNGQMEKGTEGTEHYQGILTTPQVRFAQVKKLLPRAHIELARNKKALQNYVAKSDTRFATVLTIANNIPTLFDYQHTIAQRWDDNDFEQLADGHSDEYIAKNGLDEVALEYADSLVAEDIMAGSIGVEYIAINPMWRAAWKKFWRAMVYRERNFPAISIENAYLQTPPPSQETCSQVQEESVSSKGPGDGYDSSCS